MREVTAAGPRVAIVVVTYNSARDIDAALQSLTAPPPETPHEIVVVDNASTDGTPARVRTGWPAVRLIDVWARTASSIVAAEPSCR